MHDEMTSISGQYVALQEVFDQAVGLVHVLRALAELVHKQGEQTAGRRGILQGLHRHGPQTVPQMARARPVSRQHIQMEVNQLEADGLVEFVENIAHKRSHLVQLTPLGKAYLEAMHQREAQFFTTIQLSLDEETLLSTANTLRALHDALIHAQLRLKREAE